MQNIFTNLWYTINNSKFLSVVISTIIIFLGIRFLIYIIQLLGNFRTYIVNKSESIHLENQIATNSVASSSISERIDITNAVLDLITFMVTNEIVSYFKNYTALNVPYDVSKMDDDIKIISGKVYAGINEELFKDPNLILTAPYLMQYITKKTTSTMIDVVQNHNNNVRGTNQSVGD